MEKTTGKQARRLKKLYYKKHPFEGYCFNGICPTFNAQCEKIWGYGGSAADKQCYEQFNSKGSINGHCGMDQEKRYVKCDPEYVIADPFLTQF